MIIMAIFTIDCHYQHAHRQYDLQMDFVGSVIGGAVEVATSKGGALVTTIITISLCPNFYITKDSRAKIGSQKRVNCET